LKSVAIVDYGMGNLHSVRRAFEECGADAVVTDERRVLERAAAIVLPGVGAFAAGMRNLRERGLDEVLTEQVLDREIPFLGLCLGMQLLASSSCEGGETPGLGWIDASVERLEPADRLERVPHVGWNEVHPSGESPLFAAVEPGSDFYFVHSYHVACRVSTTAAAVTPYCGGFVSAVTRDGHIFGLQFHPEKSQKAGLRVLGNFLAL
jgi:glutamine amidotransferase